jgi:hypothetical protein
VFLPLTIVTVDDRTILAVQCACGDPIDSGILLEFDSTWMLCHRACVERIEELD